MPSDWVVTDCDQSVLSKECPAEYQQVADEDIVIWVDPLDGTSEYTQVTLIGFDISKVFCRIIFFTLQSKM